MSARLPNAFDGHEVISGKSEKPWSGCQFEQHGLKLTPETSNRDERRTESGTDPLLSGPHFLPLGEALRVDDERGWRLWPLEAVLLLAEDQRLEPRVQGQHMCHRNGHLVVRSQACRTAKRVPGQDDRGHVNTVAERIRKGGRLLSVHPLRNNCAIQYLLERLVRLLHLVHPHSQLKYSEVHQL